MISEMFVVVLCERYVVLYHHVGHCPWNTKLYMFSVNLFDVLTLAVVVVLECHRVMS